MIKFGKVAVSALMAALLCLPLAASAVNILTNTANNTGYSLFGQASNMRLALQGSHSLSSTALLDNSAQLASYDALWVNDQFGAMDSAQMNAITGYISAGHKAVFITDNYNWTGWNSSLQSMLGTSITNTCASSDGAALVANSLTAGVPVLFGSSCNSLINPTPNAQLLFANAMAALLNVGQGEVLLISSVDIVGNLLYGQNNQFAQNIVAWLGDPIDVPEPDSMVLMGLAVLGLAFSRKKLSA